MLSLCTVSCPSSFFVVRSSSVLEYAVLEYCMNCCCEIGSRPEEGAMIIFARTNHPMTSGRYRDVVGTLHA